jgi:hypothetical protein
MDVDFAAPYSGLPSLLSAFDSHAAWLAKAIGLAEQLRVIDKAMNIFFMKLSGWIEGSALIRMNKKNDISFKANGYKENISLSSMKLKRLNLLLGLLFPFATPIDVNIHESI